MTDKADYKWCGPSKGAENMHPDLEWLARNVSEWKSGMLAQEYDGNVDWLPMSDYYIGIGEYVYSEKEWQAARQQLGLDQPEVTPEEDEAWEAKEREQSKSDNVNKPKHYQLREGYEVYDLRQDLAAKAANGGATYDQYSDWDRAIEYIIRMWGKNRLEDAKNGRWYLDKLIEKLEAQSD